MLLSQIMLSLFSRLTALISKFRLGFHEIHVLPDINEKPQPEKYFCLLSFIGLNLYRCPSCLINHNALRNHFFYPKHILFIFDSIKRFEDLLAHYRVHAVQKNEEGARQASSDCPWIVSDEEMEKNTAKVKLTN